MCGVDYTTKIFFRKIIRDKNISKNTKILERTKLLSTYAKGGGA